MSGCHMSSQPFHVVGSEVESSDKYKKNIHLTPLDIYNGPFQDHSIKPEGRIH